MRDWALLSLSQTQNDIFGVSVLVWTYIGIQTVQIPEGDAPRGKRIVKLL